MTAPTVIVTGLGRCGTSLVMDMLHRGGMPTVGLAPDYEDENSMPTRITDAWLREQAGKALKMLDPHRHPTRIWGLTPQLLIFLTRDPEQQAASQAKFMHWMMGMPFPTRQKRRAMISGVKNDTDLCLGRLRRTGLPLLVMPFEHLIRRPAESAAIFARFLEPAHADLSVLEMARTVLPRTPDCLPRMLEHHKLVDLQLRGRL